MSEDKSLEDFFAKKKAKKGKGKNKFTTSQTITQQVGASQKDGDKTKEQTSKKSLSSQAQSGEIVEEWIDFQEPVEKDYSGLRIQSLQISEKAEQEGADSYEQEEDGEDGEGSSKKDKLNPWQGSAASASEGSSVAPAAPVAEEAKPQSYRPPGAYRPPGMRTRMAMSGGVKGKAPEIGSEIAFPSLQAAVQASKSKEPAGSRSFEPVRHGSRTSENPADRRPRLDLENKFDALSRS